MSLSKYMISTVLAKSIADMRCGDKENPFWMGDRVGDIKITITSVYWVRDTESSFDYSVGNLYVVVQFDTAATTMYKSYILKPSGDTIPIRSTPNLTLHNEATALKNYIEHYGFEYRAIPND